MTASALLMLYTANVTLMRKILSFTVKDLREAHQLQATIYTIEYNDRFSNIEVQQWMAVYKYMNTNCFDPALAEFTCHSNTVD